jgi:PPK2 family polyphosphate:nucleotide phosphotransferase
MKNHWQPKPLSKVKLQAYDPSFVDDMTKVTAREKESALELELYELQGRLYAENKQSLLIVLQALDAGGKDGTIRKVFSGINPQGVNVISYKAPNGNELAHDFLWRIHANTPARGYIHIFNRSHYEDVLVPKVESLVSPELLERRYDHINNFEAMLTDNNTRILKFFLLISRDEQKERLQARLDDPTKRWKFQVGDLAVREKWDQYFEAYNVMLSRCNTQSSPWIIVPANKKWYRDYIVTKTIVETLREMNPQYPLPAENLDGITIPD